ncbi:hypothetical protein EIP86_011361 [Pleurotus ostreatoroseus]|nr:hypothetical protein EIP86_011361 [Pleurotus ostreatoroseus]
MSVHHRTSITETNAPYQPLSQVETPEIHPSTPLLLNEDEEVVLAEEFVAQERAASHDWRIWWIHFILGCAILLPWNAMITATPYFVSRLEGSSLKSTFSSYLSTTFTISNFLFLAHATATTNQSTNSRKVIISLGWLTLLTFTLTLSTYVHPLPGLFFAFVLLNGIAQAAAGSYLQTSVIAVASLFGPTAIQAIMSGQAAIGVAVSAVEVLSALASIRGAASPEALEESEAEEKSAFLFFGLSTIFLVLSVATQIFLTRLPAYKAIMDQYTHTKDAVTHSRHASHADDIVSPIAEVQPPSRVEKKQQLIRVAKSNRSAIAGVSAAIISSDFLYMFILLAFGLSNGYVSSLCMMAAPSVEHNPRLKGRLEDVDVAATVASFCLVGGLAVGSFTSFGVRAAVCDCNPFKS